MFFFLAAVIFVASFVLLFSLWFVIWSFTMSSSEVARTLAEDRWAKSR